MHHTTERDRIEDGWRNLHVGEQLFSHRIHGATNTIIPHEGRFFTPGQVEAIRGIYGEPAALRTGYDHETHTDQITTIEYTI